MAKNIREA